MAILLIEKVRQDGNTHWLSPEISVVLRQQLLENNEYPGIRVESKEGDPLRLRILIDGPQEQLERIKQDFITDESVLHQVTAYENQNGITSTYTIQP